jgi:hypothetical protein
MRAVIYTDERGYRRRSFVRDTDNDDMAEFGIPANPPDVEDVDWDYIKREINNALVDNGLFDWNDMNHSPIGLNVTVTLVKRAISGLYQLDKRDKKIEDN